MILQLIFTSAISFAANDAGILTATGEAFEVIAIEPASMICKDADLKPTGAKVKTAFCNLELKPVINSGAPLQIATAKGAYCRFKIGSRVKLNLVTNMCRVFIGDNCTKDGKPKNPKNLEDIQSISCGSNADWMVRESQYPESK